MVMTCRGSGKPRLHGPEALAAPQMTEPGLALAGVVLAAKDGAVPRACTCAQGAPTAGSTGFITANTFLPCPSEEPSLLDASFKFNTPGHHAKALGPQPAWAVFKALEALTVLPRRHGACATRASAEAPPWPAPKFQVLEQETRRRLAMDFDRQSE